MALDVKVASFTKSTNTSTPVDQVVTGTGFEPKALILFSVDTTSVNTFTDERNSILGFSDGTTEKCRYCTAEHNVTSTDTNRRAVSAKIITISDPLDQSIDSEADLKSFDSDGFTLTWTTNDAVATNIGYIALGGSDITNVDVNSASMGASTGNESITGVGFQPDVIMFLAIGSNALDANSGFAVDMVGAATGSANEVVMTNQSRDAQSTTASWRAVRTDGCLINMDVTGDINREASFISFDSDGFTVNWSTTTGAMQVFWLAMKGGQWNVGNDTQRTSAGTKATTGIGFQPDGLIMFTTGEDSQAIDQPESALSFGGHDGTDDICANSTDEDAQTTTDTEGYFNSTKVLMQSLNAVIIAEAEVSSLDSDGFTLDWTTADAVASIFGFIAFASDAVAARTLFTRINPNASGMI